MRALAALLAAAAVLGLAVSSCSTASDLLPDTGGPDAGPFSISGAVEPFPAATRWYVRHGLGTPSPDGLSLRLEDPFVSERLPDAGVDVATSIGADGRFSFSDIDGRVTVGLAGIVSDPRPMRLAMPSESFLFEGGPQNLAQAAAYVLPADFVEALASATGIADLGERGFLLGVVLDGSGQPVSGAGVVGHELDNARTRYLGDDLEPLPDANATGASGTFLVSGTFPLMNFEIVGSEGYAPRKALSRAGQAFLIVFQP